MILRAYVSVHTSAKMYARGCVHVTASFICSLLLTFEISATTIPT